MPTRPAKAAKTARPAKAAAPAKPVQAGKKTAKTRAAGRQEANFYELRSGRRRITYTASDKTGQPLLHYSDRKRDLSFRGEEIQQDPQPIGLLLTVTLEAIPDLQSDLLTILIPRVNLTDGEEEVETEGIFTRVKTSIGGPNLVDGQVQTYDARTFHGTASFILS
ncbi:MAG TPA: hypothetical protein VMW27_02380 [Thermoanaerobaculia bacterium]|nr:hypothetical protein [Thermoanaerobaculia bacterium]